MARSQKDIIGFWIIGVAATVIIAVFVVTYQINATKKTEASGLDKSTLCDISEKYRHIIVLIDKTDPFSASQRDEFLAKVRELKATLEQGERLSIYVLDDNNYKAPQAALSICNPGTEATANPLYQNPRQMQKKFDHVFGQPLDRVAQETLVNTTAVSSPIIEMIYSISLLHDFGPNQTYRKLVIFSDLLQNTKEFSHLKGVPLYEDYRNSAYAKALMPDLQGVHVEVVYLLRKENYQIQRSTVHQSFWGGFFQEAGASSIDFRRAG